MNSFVNESFLQEETRVKPGNPLVFIHVPKTGGMTFYSMIREIYRPFESHKINPAEASIDAYRNLPSARKNRLKVIYGHMDFGLRELLPPGSSYVTLLRHPVERVISHYYYVRRTENDPLRELAMRSTLEDWVTRCSLAEMDNGQTRRLSGVANGLAVGACSSAMLVCARENVARNFVLAGITERYDEFYLAMSKIFGWPIKNYPSINVAQSRPGMNEIPRRTLRLIEKHNALDMELYDFALHRFAERIEQLDLRHEMWVLGERRKSSYLRWRDAAAYHVKMKIRRWVPSWLAY